MTLGPWFWSQNITLHHPLAGPGSLAPRGPHQPPASLNRLSLQPPSLVLDISTSWGLPGSLVPCMPSRSCHLLKGLL